MKLLALNMPSEHVEQVSFVAEFERRYPLIRLFAIPNGGHRHKQTAKNLKLEGVRKGVPDLFIPEILTWVEMKRQKGGRLSPDQKEWIEYLESIGYTVIIGYGAVDAINKIELVIKEKAPK